GNGQVQVQRRGHAHGREVGGAVAARAHAVELGQVQDAAQVGDPAGVHDAHADEVDELLGDELLAVPDRVEDLADRQRRGGVLAHEAQVGLELGGDRVLEPEELVGLERLAQLRGFDRGEPVVHVVQEAQVGPEGVAHVGDDVGDGGQVPAG